MKIHLGLLAGALTAVTLSAFAATPQRIRGTLISADTIAAYVRTSPDKVETILLTATTRYAAATKATLAEVRQGRYIGVATKDIGGKHIALEVAIFAEPLRGTGEGHYPWDGIAGTQTTSPTSMTNGNVGSASVGSASVPPTTSMMTNGDVKSADDAAGAKNLIVTYHGGSETIVVPPNTPIVLLTPADRSILKPNQSVFVLAKAGVSPMTAIAISAGVNGTKLPM